MATGGCLCGAGLRVAGHIYVSQRGDYYELPDDGQPRLSAGRRPGSVSRRSAEV